MKAVRFAVTVTRLRLMNILMINVFEVLGIVSVLDRLIYTATVGDEMALPL